MRSTTLLSAASCIGFAALVGLQPTRAARDAKPDPVAKLVLQLGDDDFDTREAAGKALEALGEKALPALTEAAATSEDLEIRRRARRLVLLVMPTERKSKSTEMKLSRVLAGEFDMGASASDRGRKSDETQHRVRISRPFYMGTYEVTQNEYQKVMKANPSWFSRDGDGKEKVQGVVTTQFPVEQVSWFDAVEFCNKLSAEDGLKPYLELTAIKRERGSIEKATVKVLGGNGYRLPTEAEWEYACRAGSATLFHFGDTTQANVGNMKPMMVGGYGAAPRWPDLGRTSQVGNYPGNRWGLFDMHGNVQEWCFDWYDNGYYTTSPRSDPTGPTAGTHRVVRGGSWLVTELLSRSASRNLLAPGDRNFNTGFRVVRNP